VNHAILYYQAMKKIIVVSAKKNWELGNIPQELVGIAISCYAKNAILYKNHRCKMMLVK